MRKIFVSFLCVIMVMVFMPTMVFAAEGNVAKVGDTEYATLAAAVEAAKDDETIELLADAEAAGIEIEDKSLTFNLNGYTIKGTTDASYLFSPWGNETTTVFNGGTLEVVRQVSGSMAVQVVGGTCTFNNMEVRVVVPDDMNGYNYGIRAFGNVVGYDSVHVAFNDSRMIEVEDPEVEETYGLAGLTVMGKYENAAVMADPTVCENDAVLEINNSYVEATSFAVAGNGAAHGTKIDINNSDLVSKEATAIYHPQLGEMNISGGSITGVTGIEVRAGVVNLKDNVEIIATGDSTEVDPNGNGTTSTGAAVAVAQHTTKLPIALNVENASLTGASAVVANNPQENTAEDIEKIAINLNGGNFYGLVQTNDGGALNVAGGAYDKLGENVNVVAADVAELTLSDVPLTVVGLDKINEVVKAAPAGTELVITKAAENSSITVPEGVIVKNNADAAIKVNGEVLAAGQTVTVVVPDDEDKTDTDQPAGDDQKDPATGDDNKGDTDAGKDPVKEPTEGTPEKTGDANDIVLWLALMALTAAALAGTAAYSRKRG